MFRWPARLTAPSLFRGVWLLPFLVLLSPPSLGWDFDRLQRAASLRGNANGQRLFADWRELMADSRSLSEADKLKRLNEFFNRRLNFSDDVSIWGQADYWATPLESMAKGAGDCEDFVIAKYFSLKELGVPVQKLRLTYVRARIGGPNSSISQAHMVLTYYAAPDAEPLVLDNLITDIRPASRRSDLTPVFSFNSDGLWAGGTTSSGSPVDRLSRWKELLLRMQAEGFD